LKPQHPGIPGSTETTGNHSDEGRQARHGEHCHAVPGQNLPFPASCFLIIPLSTLRKGVSNFTD
jgi:hypothetical protein